MRKKRIILAHDKEIKELTDAHADQVKKLRRKQYYLNQENKEYTDKVNDGDVSFFMNKCLHRTRSKEKCATFVLNMVVSGEMFGQKGKQAGQKFVRKQCRKTYTAWGLCKAKDTCHQGCLNLQGIEAVRQVEDLEKYERGMLPSKSSVWREGDELLRKVGYPTFKVTHQDNLSLGEVVMLDFERVVRFVLLINGLIEIARRCSVELGFSVDAGSLTSNTSHIYGGCKNLDS